MSEFSMINLYLPFILGYSLIWGTMVFVDSKRDEKIEDRDQYKNGDRWIRFVRGFVPTMILIIISFFIPLAKDVLLITGLLFYALGIFIFLVTNLSFLKVSSGLNTNGLYRYSRNPMYIGGVIFILGLNIMSWSTEMINYLFLFFSIVWIVIIHLHVLGEEKFLLNKYGESYIRFSKNTPRYLGIIKKIN